MHALELEDNMMAQSAVGDTIDLANLKNDGRTGVVERGITWLS